MKKVKQGRAKNLCFHILVFTFLLVTQILNQVEKNRNQITIANLSLYRPTKNYKNPTIRKHQKSKKLKKGDNEKYLIQIFATR